jgi:hypothetical protein
MKWIEGNSSLLRWYREYAQHDGWGRNRIYNAFIKKPRKQSKQTL